MTEQKAFEAKEILQKLMKKRSEKELLEDPGDPMISDLSEGERKRALKRVNNNIKKLKKELEDL